ncbi:hypothetical protein WN943_015294 [Citrus x changshan-huyou]
MGERVIDGEWKPTSPSNGERIVVLLGRTGNGKSATGNSILRRRAFKASAGLSGVTKTCKMKTTVLKDGQVVNVIDTPDIKFQHNNWSPKEKMPMISQRK